MKNILTFDQFINEENIYKSEFTNSIIEEIQSELKEIEIQSLFEDDDDEVSKNLTLEQLEEICEDLHKKEMEDIISEKEEDSKMNFAKKAFMSKADRDDKSTSDKYKEEKATEGSVLFASAVVGIALATPTGGLSLLAPLAVKISGILQKKEAIRSALKKSGLEGKKKEALRAKLSKLSDAEIEAYKERSKIKAKAAAANKVAKGEEPTPPKNASKEVKQGYSEGVKIGQMALEKGKKVASLPKDKKDEIKAKAEDAKKNISQAKEEDKKAMQDIDKIKKKK